jgi:hypothetical protein
MEVFCSRRSLAIFGRSLDEPIRGMAIFRWRDGHITEEVSGQDRLNGRQIESAHLLGASGTNYLFGVEYASYTTLPGYTRPSNTALQIRNDPAGLTVNWTNYGRLQFTTNFVQWQDLQNTAGTVTNEPGSPARFYRVLHP